MADHHQPKPLELRPLAPYEDRLLKALAFFRTKRQLTTQAHHCLSMYLRQSEARIMGEVQFYAHLCDRDAWEMLDLIYTNPDEAERLILEITGVEIKQVFEDGRDEERLG